MILTYEAQHEKLLSTIQATVASKNWDQLASDAADLATLEGLIAKAPSTPVPAAQGAPTVMVHPLK